MPNVGILFSDVQNFSKLTKDQAKVFGEEVLPSLGLKIQAYRRSLIDLNTWGDSIFATSEDAMQLTRMAMEIRDFFLRPASNHDLLGILKIRIALDFGLVDIGANPITKTKRACRGPRLSLPARLEPVTPPNTVFATEDLARHLAGNYPDQVQVTYLTENNAPPEIRKDGILYLQEFVNTIYLPKDSGQIRAFSLHWATETSKVTWNNELKRLDAIAPIQVNTWFVPPKQERHQMAKQRLDRCVAGEEVCFIAITGKSFIYPELVGPQAVRDTPVAKALLKDVHLRAIVMDPEGDEALLRSIIETPNECRPSKRLLERDAARVASIPEDSAWAQLRDRVKNQFELKMTRYGLSFNLWLFNDLALIEPYHLGKLPERHDDTPNMCIFSQFTIPSSRGTEYDMLKQHFENLWTNSEYVWPKLHGPRNLEVSSLLEPKTLKDKLATQRRLHSSPIHILQLVSNTLQIGGRLHTSFKQVGTSLRTTIETRSALGGEEDLDRFVRKEGEKPSFVLVQVHGMEKEERLLEPALRKWEADADIIAYIHRPEELLLRIGEECKCNYRAARGFLADLLRRTSAVVLPGKAFVEEYRRMLPDLLVTAIPLGFAKNSDGDDLNSRLKTGVTFVGSSTTWGEMRHLSDLEQLIGAIQEINASIRVTAYASGKFGALCNLKDFIKRQGVVTVGNNEITRAFELGEFKDEEGFRSWLYNKAPGQCIIRAVQKDGNLIAEEPVKHSDLELWEKRLIDFNLQLYHEILDSKREPERRGLPKVEYAGTLHKGLPHELFVVFDSLAMRDVERDEGFQMIHVPVLCGIPDFAKAANRILELIGSPDLRRKMIEDNQRSTADLTMNEIAFAFGLLVRHLADTSC